MASPAFCIDTERSAALLALALDGIKIIVEVCLGLSIWERKRVPHLDVSCRNTETYPEAHRNFEITSWY
jgi:hypothetical protein